MTQIHRQNRESPMNARTIALSSFTHTVLDGPMARLRSKCSSPSTGPRLQWLGPWFSRGIRV